MSLDSPVLKQQDCPRLIHSHGRPINLEWELFTLVLAILYSRHTMYDLGHYPGNALVCWCESAWLCPMLSMHGPPQIDDAEFSSTSCPLLQSRRLFVNWVTADNIA